MTITGLVSIRVSSQKVDIALQRLTVWPVKHQLLIQLLVTEGLLNGFLLSSLAGLLMQAYCRVSLIQGRKGTGGWGVCKGRGTVQSWFSAIICNLQSSDLQCDDHVAAFPKFSPSHLQAQVLQFPNTSEEGWDRFCWRVIVMCHAASANIASDMKTHFFNQAWVAISPAPVTEGHRSICFLRHTEKASQAEVSVQHIHYLLIASKLHCDLSRR